MIAFLVTFRHAQDETSRLSFGQQGLGMLLLSLALCTFLFATRWQNTWLARVGPYSYAIFLFHLFFTSGSREFMQRFQLSADTYVLFAFGMSVGLVGPILAQHALLRRAGLAWLFLGQRTRVVKLGEETTRETVRAAESVALGREGASPAPVSEH